MRRLAVLASVLVLLACVLAFAHNASDTAAQDSTPDAMAAHPVVGVWRTVVSNEGDTPFASLSTFHADGAYTEVLPDGLVLSGVWRPTGERTVALTAYLNYFLDDRLVEATVRLAVEVDETGNALTEEGAVVGLYEDGSVAIAVESPATGARLEILPMEPLGTPVLPPDLAAAGTPAP